MFATFHVCMHGGHTPKQTTIAGDIPELLQLEATCVGQHVCFPWGTTDKSFPTAEEAEYPFAPWK